MKKMNILKIAFTLVLAISFSVAFGQAKDADLTVDNGTAHTVTVGKAIPFYVTPDAYFNPLYAGTDVVTSTFLWSFDNLVLTGGSEPAPGDGVFSDNSVINPDVTFGATGAYVLAVRESSADCDVTIQTQ